jgi:hypothetical protein
MLELDIAMEHSSISPNYPGQDLNHQLNCSIILLITVAKFCVWPGRNLD